jgi:hypothetical protein
LTIERKKEREKEKERKSGKVLRVLLTCFDNRKKKRERDRKTYRLAVFGVSFFIACLIKGKGIFWCH